MKKTLTHPIDPKKIKNYNSNMSYRNFGKTQCPISVITLGGMRFYHTFDGDREDIPKEMLERCRDNVGWALDTGINHIETAYNYGKSEYCYGKALNQELGIKRDRYYLMSKGWPKSSDEARRTVEEQLKGLQTSYIDFYAWHGINNRERMDFALKKNGANNSPVEELLKMKEEGIIKHLGFSTHAPLSIILETIQTDLFDFINLHYYYFFQRNYGAVMLAEEKNMGVFIISPNDKGGQLFHPPAKLKRLTAPLTPIQWNARFCLSHRSVHTLSFGMNEKSHYDEMKGIFPLSYPMSRRDKKILFKMNQQELLDPYSDYQGYDLLDDPSGINIPEILRFRKLWKCFNMTTYVKYRYNMMGQGNWFPGNYPYKKMLNQIDLSKVPPHIPIKDMLWEVHKNFYIKK